MSRCENWEEHYLAALSLIDKGEHQKAEVLLEREVGSQEVPQTRLVARVEVALAMARRRRWPGSEK